MRKVLGPTALVIVLAISALAPAAAGHAAPDPLANSVHVIADEPEDTFYWYDGYDLYNLFVREAYVQTLDESGLVFRFALYGGFAPASTSDELAIDVEATSPDGAKSLTVATSDDEAWEGDLEVLVANVTEDEPPWTGVTARMQVFASYDQLGAQPGASLEDLRMLSRADDDLRDVAPGGIFVPHSQGEGEVPTDSQRLVDSLSLEGPHGYIDTSVSSTDGGLTVETENLLENGQHVSVELEAPTGWNASVNGSAQASLPGGETQTFAIEALPTPDAGEPLAVHVVTDLGGHQTVYAGVNGTEITTALEPNAADVEPAAQETDESPGLGSIGTIALLAALAWAHRRPD